MTNLVNKSLTEMQKDFAKQYVESSVGSNHLTNTEVAIQAGYSPESAYQKLLSKLQEYDTRFRSAVNSNDVAYIIDNDDFLPVREGHTNKKKKRSFSPLAAYIFIPLISFGFLGVSYEINQERPFKPAYSKT